MLWRPCGLVHLTCSLPVHRCPISRRRPVVTRPLSAFSLPCSARAFISTSAPHPSDRAEDRPSPQGQPPPPGAKDHSVINELVKELNVILSASKELKGVPIIDAVKASPRLLGSLSDSKVAAMLAKAMVGTPYPHLAGHVLTLSHHLGSGIHRKAHEGLVERLASAEKWHLIPPIVVMCQKHTSNVSVRLLNWKSAAYMHTSDFASLERTLDAFRQAGRVPNRRTYHILIAGYIRNHDVRHAQQTLQLMEAAGIPVNASTHALLVARYRRLGPDATVRSRALDAARDASTDMKLSAVILNGLLQMCLDAHDLPGALSMLRHYHWRQQDSTAQVPNLGDGRTADGVVSTSDSELDQVTPTSLPPADVATFTILINYFARHPNLSKALGGVRQMISAGILPDDVALVALIRAYMISGHVNDAVTVLALVCQEFNISFAMFTPLGVQVSDFDTYNLYAFTSLHIRPTSAMFNALLEGLLPRKGLRSLTVVLDIMDRLSLCPDGKTADIFIQFLTGHDAVRPREVMRIVRRLWGTHLHPTARHALLILREIVRYERNMLHGVGWNSTVKFVSGAHRAMRVAPSRLTGNSDSLDPSAGLSFPDDLKRSSGFVVMQRYLRRQGVRSDRAAFALRIKRDAVNRADFDSAKEILQIMIARGLHPNMYHYSALMEGYAILGDVKSTREVMASANENGIAMNTVMYTILITAYARAGLPRGATLAFREMLNSQCRPDVASINALIGAYFAVRAFRTARGVLLQLWAMIAPFPGEMQAASLETLIRSFRTIDVRNKAVDKRGKLLRRSKSYRPTLQRIVAEWRKLCGADEAE